MLYLWQNNMPKRHHTKIPLERKIIDRLIFFVAFVQPLGGIPQIVTVFRQHNATSISLTSWLIYIVFDLMWLWYGLSHKQKAVVVSALMFTVTEGLVLIGGLLYGGSW